MNYKGVAIQHGELTSFVC